ncbi:hypothetical protein F4782DRAFT_180591 [Xylaria castorea]|nr:hypothetical protein F4782DRAFT_180591 [Xylaria castorea]
MFCQKKYCQPPQTNHSTPVVPATTFTGFNKLPTELRLMIWEEFARTPRVIRIDLNGTWNKKHREGQFVIKINDRVREQACPLLGVCHESRSVAEKSMLLFTIGSRDIRKIFSTGDRHFAIRSRDIVFFSGSRMGFGDIFVQGDTDKIANIMLGGRRSDIYGDVGIESSERIWANWLAFGYSGLRLAQYLGNRRHLEGIYGLVHGNKHTGAVRCFDMDDLCEFGPRHPPDYSCGFADWLKREFLPKPEWDSISQSTFMPHLVMLDEELTPFIESNEALVTRKK